MVRRRRSSVPQEDRAAAPRGSPAPFTEEEVEALRHGNLDEALLISVLEGHRQPEMADVGRRPKKMAPVDLNERALHELSQGSTPTAIRNAMEKAGKRDRDRTATIDERQDRPKQKPRR